jgi:translation elongation factor EF-1alpha
MATKFVFPKAPKVGDRIEIVSISESKLPINIVGNSEAGKNLKLIFPDETKTDVADGEAIIATINENNTVYTFKCVTAQDIHTWLLEGTCLYPEIVAIKARVDALETALAEMIGDVE